MSKTRAPKAPPIYRAENARRIMAGHLSNFYSELIDVDECVRNLDALARHAHDGGDEECGRMATALANELIEGKRPAVLFPEHDIATVLSPEAAEAADAERELLEAAEAAPADAREARAIAEAELERDHGESDRGQRGESTGEADRGMRDSPVEEEAVHTRGRPDTAPRIPSLRGPGSTGPRPRRGSGARAPRTPPKRTGSRQCRGKTKKGVRCNANAVEGQYCRAHEDQEGS